MSRSQRGWMAVLIVAVGLSVAGLASTPVTRELAISCARKIDQIAKAPALGKERRTVLSEGELNSWLAYVGGERIPPGVSEPTVTLIGEGRVAGRAQVDLDLMGKKRGSGSLLDPWSYLSGRVPVTATGRIRTEQGVGRFVLESAQISGLPVPKWLLQELVTFYAKSPSRPQGVSMDEAFPLPVGIDTLEVNPGQAVVVQ